MASDTSGNVILAAPPTVELVEFAKVIFRDWSAVHLCPRRNTEIFSAGNDLMGGILFTCCKL
jgi:hypothetical protein